MKFSDLQSWFLVCFNWYISWYFVFNLQVPWSCFLESQRKIVFRFGNGIFYKCKDSMCETVMMHLFNSYCKPIPLCALESVCLTNSSLSLLSQSWHVIFWKLFGVNWISCIDDILNFMGYLLLATETDAHRVGFFT